MIRRLVFAWGVGGVAALLAWAMIRLGGQGLGVVRGGLDLVHWVVLAALAVVFVWGEGVMALDRRWAPRVVERARRLAGRPPAPLHVVAPLHAMGLVGAERAVLVRSWGGVAAVVVAVVLVRALPEPWRGMVDVSVALALALGVWALLRRAVRNAPARP